ncbi:hypothetical protein ACKVMT_11615 [Halobacteriales archaeon Cl-PHB]
MQVVDDAGDSRELLSHPSRQELFDILGNARRRYTIRYLLQRSEPVSLRELSEQVAAWENGKAATDVTSSERHRVYNALQQAHLPKMARAGVIRLDRGVVYPNDTLDDFEVYMEIVSANDIPWSVYFTALGVVGSLVAFGHEIGVPVLRDISPTVLLGTLGVILTISGVINVWTQQRVRIDATGDPPGS